MSDQDNKTVCGDNGLPALCSSKFKYLDKKLDAIHDDMKQLVVKVNNGLSSRLVQLECHQDVIRNELAKKASRIARWETAIISAIVTMVAGVVIYVVKMIVNNHP